VVKNTGNYVNPGAIGLPNDSVSSIKVGSNVVLRLYEHDNYAGRSSSFSNNDSNLSNDTIGDNSVSSMKVERRTASCNPSADQVALYVDTDYRGQCVVKNLGSYVSPGAIGLPNDSISSVKVGSNVMLRLYEHDNYAGRASLFTGNDSNLGDNTIGNDSVSSMKVERRNSLNLALGRPSWASSVEASYATANKGNDGNTGTRWSSRHSSTNTNELWRVDLGSGAMFDKVKIRWETAYARRYFVGWSNDGNNLTGYWYSMSSAGYYGYTLGTRTARYAVVYMTEHAPCCGNYSFWEFEVVRTGALSEEGLRSGGESSEVILAVPESELVTIQLPMQMWIAP
jgi:hypothetical protein